MGSVKRGRPRLNGERYPAGRLRPGDYRSDTQIRRIVDQGFALGLDPMLGSQAGTLRLQGHLNDRHLAVIDYIGRVYGRYELHAGLQRQAQSPPTRPRNARPEAVQSARRVRARRVPISSRCSGSLRIFPTRRAVIERLCVDDLHIPASFVPDLIVLLERIDAALGGRPLSRRSLPLRRRVPVPS